MTSNQDIASDVAGGGGGGVFRTKSKVLERHKGFGKCGVHVPSLTLLL